MRVGCAVLVCVFLLSACVSPQKAQKTRADFSTFNAGRHDRDIEEHCAEQTMPGTTANLECQLALQKQAGADASKH